MYWRLYLYTLLSESAISLYSHFHYCIFSIWILELNIPTLSVIDVQDGPSFSAERLRKSHLFLSSNPPQLTPFVMMFTKPHLHRSHSYSTWCLPLIPNDKNLWVKLTLKTGF